MLNFTGKNERYKHSGRGRDLEMLDCSNKPSISDRLFLLWVSASYEDRISVFCYCFRCGYCNAVVFFAYVERLMCAFFKKFYVMQPACIFDFYYMYMVVLDPRLPQAIGELMVPIVRVCQNFQGLARMQYDRVSYPGTVSGLR